MAVIEYLLLGALIVCAIAANITQQLLPTILIYMVFSVIMSILWLILQAPDLAITEAAVGVGISGMLFFILLRRIHKVDRQRKEDPTDE